jgi:hypothetical protein
MSKKLLLILSFFFACTPQKKLQRLQNRHPQLFESVTITDTLTVITPNYITDAVLVRTNDTMKVRESKINLDLFITDTTIYYQIECKSDTIRVPYEVKCPLTAKKHKKNYIKYLVLIFLILLLLLFLKLVK